MIRIFYMALMIIGLLTSIDSYASLSDDGVPYHCPSINDITYNNDLGQFEAETHYNNVKVRWFSLRHFAGSTGPKIKFKSSNNNNCIGKACEINCLYTLESDEYNFVRFQISYGDCEFLKPISGQWDDHNSCKADDPESCVFAIIKSPVFYSGTACIEEVNRLKK